MQARSELIKRIWRSRSGRVLVLLLAGLAPFLLGISIYWKFANYRTHEFATSVGRTKAVELANRFLEAHGVAKTGEWEFQFREDSDLLAYIHRRVGERVETPPIAILPTTPATIWLRQSGTSADRPDLSIGPAGRILAYSLPVPGEAGASTPQSDGGASARGIPMDREEGMRQARDALARVLIDPSSYILSEPRIYEQPDSRGRAVLRIEWTATPAKFPELSFDIRFGFAGGALFSQRVSSKVDNAYLKSGGPMVSLHSAINLLAPFYVIALIVYMMVRYVQRSLEKEVSHGRALVVAGYIMAMVSVVFLLGDESVVFNVNTGDSSLGAAMFFIYFFFSLMALLAGMCYEECEEDVRERFMGSLIAFDALLTGRILSRNVARAFVVGFVGAAWLFFAQVGANLLFEGGVEEPSSLVFVYRMAFAKYPAVVALLMIPVGIGILLTFGLLVPLGIVSRFDRLRRAGWPLIALAALVNIFLLHGGFLTVTGAVVILGAEVAVLLALIYAFDLLSAYVCVVLTGFISLLSNLQMLTTVSANVLLPLYGTVAVTLLAALVLLRYGKDYTDEEVRPAYARAVAERQLLSAQISTAAVAQANLTRDSVPQVDGFSIAVECRPARVVSGDYYDFYPLGGRSLGVLMIGGEGRGLLDAMLIAFTKGFLLERAHASRSSQEVVSDLLENLGSLLQPGDEFPELCFLVLDGEKNTAAYARTEDFPGVLSLREDGQEGVTIRHGAKAEIALTRTIAERAVTLRNGTVHLDEHDSLLLFTRGFERGLKRSGVVDFREWLRGEWRNLASSDAGITLQKLTAAAFGGTRWQHTTPHEDLTLMVMHTVAIAAGEVERAA